MKNSFIFIDNLPMFERYEIIDSKDEDMVAISEVLNENNIKGVYTTEYSYIKGINRKERDENKIKCDAFFQAYLNLGKKLFELATSKNKIKVISRYEITDISDLTSRYSEMYYFPIVEQLTDAEYDMTVNINKFISKFTSLYLSNKVLNKEKISEVIDLAQDCLGNLLALSDTPEEIIVENKSYKNYNIYSDLLELESILSLINNKLSNYMVAYNIFEEKEIITKANEVLIHNIEKLELIKNTLVEKLDESSFKDDLKKNLSNGSRSLSKISNVDFYEDRKQAPIIIKFSYYQKKKVHSIIKSWLKKYGFPYYISKKLEKEYLEATRRMFKLENDEFIIPCNNLIVNSVYNYMYYTLCTEREVADERILSIFNFIPKENNRKSRSKRINNTQIANIKETLNYYNNIYCSKIFGFNCMTISEMKDSFSEDDKKNYFNHDSVDDGMYVEYFNNLCIAMNRLIPDKINEFKIKHNGSIGRCPICKKIFDKKNKEICCSEDCEKIRVRKRKRENKREERKRGKNLNKD